MLRFDRVTYLSLLVQSISSGRLINSLKGSDVLLFSVFINIVFILFYNLHDIKNLLFDGFHSGFIIRIYSFKFSDVLSAFTCARAIGNLWSICLEVNILSPFSWNDACLASDTIVE